ncbi:NAD(P)H-hydrate dehydratase [Shewanella surugensis]|uniref:Bifunctional NAD(P)H-hydrate repair enzyme n=1 Tax=Shewanella surugensis TaxID=212020 RepID=A0ABT0LF06_9GAMM|nr:NAD(P)H-hydrate dehydratase [Shewanella surugensis]MCL1126144.1 NAD(P)H-hydrate dehydratase [Shewanella surugensis]
MNHDALTFTTLYLSKHIKEAEIRVVDKGHTSLFGLVEFAAAAAFELLKQLEKTAEPIYLLAGNGNNGSDTYLLASLLLHAGIQASVMSHHKTHLSTELERAKGAYLSQGGTVQPFNVSVILGAQVIVDGLLGTGLRKGKLTPELESVISAVNESKAWVLSLDVPSGIDADTGFAFSSAIIADVTLSFGGIKQGLYTGRARHCTGQVHHAFVGLINQLPESKTIKVSQLNLAKMLPPRQKDSHKGDNGKVLIIGGDTGMVGAVSMAAEACLRAGAGLVSVISKSEHLMVVSSRRPEIMFCACDRIDKDVRKRFDWADVLVIGPGLGRGPWGEALLNTAKHCNKHCVVDADALNLLKGQGWHHGDWILTPHSGEAARLLDISRVEVEQDRFSAVKQIYQIYGGVVVLKGAGTLIYDGEQMIVVPVGNPGLATAGSGDVLSGVIGALLAQGLTALHAAILGVVVHGKAADLAIKEGERGMLASDLMLFIRKLLNENIIKI